MKTITAFVFLVLSCFCMAPAYAITFDWAHVGNADNTGELSGTGAGGIGPDAIVGAVAYSYAISKTGVTNAQYTEFLNSVAATDPYGLYNSNMSIQTQAGITRSGSPNNYTYAVKADAIGQGPGGTDYNYADKPVIYVTWYDSIRFTNWLHNGQGAGATETGAYTILGGTARPSNGRNITRNMDARYWLPSEDEWYKAAYHDASVGTAGTYFDYATGTNTAPDNNPPSTDSGNSANYFDGGYTYKQDYPLTDVNAYSLSESPYGTYDQNGNVWEWNEALVSSSLRGVRGGPWPDDANSLAALNRIGGNPAVINVTIGFRVATVPEPSSLCLLVGLASGMLLQRQR